MFEPQSEDPPIHKNLVYKEFIFIQKHPAFDEPFPTKPCLTWANNTVRQKGNMFLEALQQKPKSEVYLSDDEDSVPVFRELGLFDRLEKQRRLTPIGTIIFGRSRHPTHWIICAHFSGCKKKSDDGYIVWCMPKRAFSELEATQQLQILAKREGVENWVAMRFDSGEDRN